MIKRSSDSIKAQIDIETLTTKGGTIYLSYSQLISILVNLSDAQANLSSNEYRGFMRIVSFYRKRTRCVKATVSKYRDMRNKIINKIEKYYPFMLVDGIHSNNLQYYQQLLIRKLHKAGEAYNNAAYRYDKDNIPIPYFLEYDPIMYPRAKSISHMMFFLVSDYISLTTDGKLSKIEYGIYLGIADSFYKMYRNTDENVIPKEEAAINSYIKIMAGTDCYNDSAIEAIFLNMRKTSDLLYNKNKGQPSDIVVLDSIMEYLDSIYSHSGYFVQRDKLYNVIRRCHSGFKKFFSS